MQQRQAYPRAISPSSTSTTPDNGYTIQVDNVMTTRRQILQSAVAPMIVPSLVLGQRAGAVPPSDKIIFGGIGIGARGAHVLSKILAFDQAKFVAICDVRSQRREEIKS